MEQNDAVCIAQSLFEQKNYLGALDEALKMIKNPSSAKQGYLIFAKAFISAIPSINNTENLDTFYTTVGEVARRAESAKEFFEIEAELQEVYEEWHRMRHAGMLQNLENNPSFKEWGNIIMQSVPYAMVSMKITGAMLNAPNVTRMLNAEGGPGAARKKYELEWRNQFTAEEKNTMDFEAACRLHKRVLSQITDGSADDVLTQQEVLLEQLGVIDLMFNSSIPKAGKGDDQIIISRNEDYARFVDDVLEARIFVNGCNRLFLPDDKREDWEASRAKAKEAAASAQKRVEKRREEEEKKKRFEAYWEAHAEEKAKLDAERSQLEERINELNRYIEKSQNEEERIQQSKKENLPIEKEYEKQRELIRILENERAKCGIFKGRQKKALTERMNLIERPRLEELKKEAAEARKKHNNNMDIRLAEVRKEAEPYRQEKTQILNRIKEIEEELTKER